MFGRKKIIYVDRQTSKRIEEALHQRFANSPPTYKEAKEVVDSFMIDRMEDQ